MALWHAASSVCLVILECLQLSAITKKCLSKTETGKSMSCIAAKCRSPNLVAWSRVMYAVVLWRCMRLLKSDFFRVAVSQLRYIYIGMASYTDMTPLLFVTCFNCSLLYLRWSPIAAAEQYVFRLSDRVCVRA